MTTTDLYLKFPDEATALAVATAIVKAGNPDLPEEWAATSFPADGSVGSNRYDIAMGIPPMQETGETDPETGDPIMEPMPGFYLIGRWRGGDPIKPRH